MKRVMLMGALALGFAAPAFAQKFAPVQVQLAKPAPGFGGGGMSPAQMYFQGMTVKQKVSQSELVASGKLTAEKDTLEHAQYQGAPVKTTFKIFTLKVESVLIGGKAETLKIAIPPSDPAQIPFEGPGGFPGGGGNFVYRPYINNVQVIDGQEGTFFLRAMTGVKDTYNLVSAGIPLNPLDTKYKENIEVVKAIAAILKDPVKALKADKAEDRFYAATILVGKYRAYPPNAIYGVDQEPIPDEESKLILKAIAEADWAEFDKQPAPNEVRSNDWYEKNPVNLVYQMNLYPGQGGFPKVTGQGGNYNAEFGEKFREWLKDSGEKFQVKYNKAKTEPGKGGTPGNAPSTRPIKRGG